LRKDLIACLRHGRAKRRPRSRGQDWRGQIPEMLSLHVRPPEVEDRLVSGHWEGDLVKGARNQSAVGTLVERASRLVLLARMEGATAEAALAGFTCIYGARRSEGNLCPRPANRDTTQDAVAIAEPRLRPTITLARSVGGYRPPLIDLDDVPQSTCSGTHRARVWATATRQRAP